MQDMCSLNDFTNNDTSTTIVSIALGDARHVRLTYGAVSAIVARGRGCLMPHAGSRGLVMIRLLC
jgi:hypothetical protein